MARQIPLAGPGAGAHRPVVDARALILHLHGLVTYGPSDLGIASAMSAHGYDEVKWAEGQAMLAELVSYDSPAPGILVAAGTWYEEAQNAARRALSAQPDLLAKLGLVPPS